MTVQFIRGLTNFTLVVAPTGLQRGEPTILPDKTLFSAQQRKNIGTATFEEEQEYRKKQSRHRRRAWNEQR